MVVLYAFVEGSFPYDEDSFGDFFACGWFPIAKMDTLRDLSKKEFQHFCKFYGKDNLRLRCEEV